MGLLVIFVWVMAAALLIICIYNAIEYVCDLHATVKYHDAQIDKLWNRIVVLEHKQKWTTEEIDAVNKKAEEAKESTVEKPSRTAGAFRRSVRRHTV